MHHLITTAKEVAEVSEILSRESIIALDTEFIRETTFFPSVALLQVATERQAWLIDPTVLDQEAMKPLLNVFTDSKILKVVHAAYADQECLFWKYAVLADPILDTAIAAALCGLGDNAGLSKVLWDVLGVTLPKGRARAKWLQRPLPEELLKYAELDVLHLVKLAKKFQAELQRRNRWDWALQESFIPAGSFELVPEDVAHKSFYGGQIDAPTVPILAELVRWREHRAKTANRPRSWIADNDTLVSLAKSQPRKEEELKSFRGLQPKEIERSGRDIMAAIIAGREKAQKGEIPEARTRRRIEVDDHLGQFVRTFMSYLAKRHEIALRYLINMNKVAWLVTLPTPEEWVANGVITKQAAELIGDELVAFLQGKRALVLKECRLEVVTV